MDGKKANTFLNTLLTPIENLEESQFNALFNIPAYVIKIQKLSSVGQNKQKNLKKRNIRNKMSKSLVNLTIRQKMS